MFDGGEQFHQFIASSRTSLPIPLSFPLHGNPSFSAAFDPYAPPLHHQEPPPSTAAKNLTPIDSKHALVHKYPLISTNLALESERSTDPWSNDELLSLLKVRSSMEIWFPDFTWEHVSRKLGELGFKRSGEQCKEKFEEESRHFNSKNYRILSELDEFYHEEEEDDDDNDQEQEQEPPPQISTARSHRLEVDQEKVVVLVEENINSRNAAENEETPSQEVNHGVKKPPTTATKSSSKKRKRRRDKFEMFKGFCEAVVNKMMSKQEELHNKLIEDMLKMDREKVARDEAWKNQEMDRIKAEIETRSKEQRSAAERQATIISFLKQFTSHQDKHLNNIDLGKVNNNNNNINSNNNSNSNSNSSTSYHDVETPSMICQDPSLPSQTSPTKTPSPSSPSSSILAAKDSMTTPNTDPITPPPPPPPSAGDVGRRWPRDEVLALINLRCKMSSSINVGDHESKEGSNSKGPLWERISQGMMELGYKRNAKRCKEKWENINKYFRKTKDSSKKRSVNSRTCPYFHQLSCLYSDGTIVAPATMPENLQ
ncbi:hypothetical protein C2S53_017453 [Perilla frutescens var. hirtella]|uniref:Myb-like domain-containing protein n=1 Tax=Perilla frutescens var. hirtella TaxID=608512 RepID=A0AAD4NZ88_PERFH|nr:hypothetical protein C2S53_017453 [Perilla frutescens var. hirtella]